MRQTVLPTKIHGTIAPERSESFARRFAPVGHRSARRQGLRFGLPLTPESGGPSRHRAAQFARAMGGLCARIVEGGQFRVGDAVAAMDITEELTDDD